MNTSIFLPDRISLKVVTEDSGNKAADLVLTESSSYTVSGTLEEAFAEAFAGADWYAGSVLSPLLGNLPGWIVQAWESLSSLSGVSHYRAVVSADGGQSVQMYTIYAVEKDEFGEEYTSADFYLPSTFTLMLPPRG